MKTCNVILTTKADEGDLEIIDSYSNIGEISRSGDCQTVYQTIYMLLKSKRTAKQETR